MRWSECSEGSEVSFCFPSGPLGTTNTDFRSGRDVWKECLLPWKLSCFQIPVRLLKSPLAELPTDSITTSGWHGPEQARLLCIKLAPCTGNSPQLGLLSSSPNQGNQETPALPQPSLEGRKQPQARTPTFLINSLNALFVSDQLQEPLNDGIFFLIVIQFQIVFWWVCQPFCS